MLKQKLQQKLLQKLSPQQIQMIKLLEIPTIQLEQRIKKELEENPVLEEGEEDEIPEEQEEEISEENIENDPEEFSFEDYLNEEDIPPYKLTTNNYSRDDVRVADIPFSVGDTYRDYLESQLGLRELTERERLLAGYLL